MSKTDIEQELKNLVEYARQCSAVGCSAGMVAYHLTNLLERVQEESTAPAAIDAAKVLAAAEQKALALFEAHVGNEYACIDDIARGASDLRSSLEDIAAARRLLGVQP